MATPIVLLCRTQLGGNQGPLFLLFGSEVVWPLFACPNKGVCSEHSGAPPRPRRDRRVCPFPCRRRSARSSGRRRLQAREAREHRAGASRSLICTERAGIANTVSRPPDIYFARHLRLSAPRALIPTKENTFGNRPASDAQTQDQQTANGWVRSLHPSPVRTRNRTQTTHYAPACNRPKVRPTGRRAAKQRRLPTTAPMRPRAIRRPPYVLHQLRARNLRLRLDRRIDYELERVAGASPGLARIPRLHLRRRIDYMATRLGALSGFALTPRMLSPASR
ncbi:hypothetical protein DFP72DRAFT_222610 [Ephemerocybe angulata]|uniref:Uncharacterized protein n=1 Tax=Ephemerocybe angulata TaxID=980116 RepID=A0A8H6M6K7_9AGAR|nr:hypothetical protein DFP72DRAFT_222610 [Tulosesus angulatus]